MEIGNTLGIIGLAVGFAGTAISNIAEKKDIEDLVRKEVAKQKEEEEKKA